MKQKTNTKIVALFTVIAMVLNLFFPLLGNIVKAETNVTVNVQKVYYNEKKKREANETDGFQFSRKDKTIPSWAKVYDSKAQEKWGQVEFTIYKIKADKQTQTVDQIKADLDNCIDTATAKTSALDANGIAKIELKNLNENKPEKYAIVETKTSSAKLFAAKAEPMVLELPYIDSEGLIANLDLAAKNQFTTINFDFQKIGEDTKAIKDAKYTLYKGTPAKISEAKVVGEAGQYKTDNDGKFTIKDLVFGDYFLVESPSANVTDTYGNPSQAKPYQLGKNALKDVNNTLTFGVDGSGIVYPAGSTFKTNGSVDSTGTQLAKDTAYITPMATKKMLTKTEDIAPGKPIKYEVHVDLPGNIEEYKKYEFIDTRSEGLEAPGAATVKTPTGDTVKVTPNTNGNKTTFTVTGLKNTTKTLKFTYEMKLKTNVTADTKIWNAIETKFTPPYNENTGKDENGNKTVDPVVEKDKKDKGEQVTDEDKYKNPPADQKTGTDDPNNSADPDNNNKTDGNNPDKGKYPRDDEEKPGKKEDSTPTVKLNDLTIKSGVTLKDGEEIEYTLTRQKGGNTQYYDEATKSWGTTEKTLKATATTPNVVIKGLTNGDYTVNLKTVPSNYKMPIVNKKEVKFTQDGKNKEEVSFSFNKLTALPFTGSEQLVILGLIGVAIIATGAVVLKKRNK